MVFFFLSNSIVVLIERINTRRNAARRLEEEISNAGAPPHGDRVPPVEEDANMEHAQVNPPPLTNENIRTAQAITTQAQAATTQVQAMTDQAN